MVKNWYRKKNFIDNVNCSNSQITDIITFQNNYGLDGCELIDIISRDKNLLLVLLYSPRGEELEQYWTSSVQEWPILLLYFSEIKSVHIDYVLDEDLPFTEIFVEIKKVQNDSNELFETTIDSVVFHKLKILHGKELHILMFDKNENIIKLNKL